MQGDIWGIFFRNKIMSYEAGNMVVSTACGLKGGLNLLVFRSVPRRM